MQVEFLSYEIATTDTIRLANIVMTLATSYEEMLTGLVHEYLQHIPDQQNLPTYSRVVDNVSDDLVLQQTVDKNGLT